MCQTDKRWIMMAKKRSGMIIHPLNYKRQKQADLCVQDQPGTDEVSGKEKLFETSLVNAIKCKSPYLSLR